MMEKSKAGKSLDLGALEEFHRFSWLLSAEQNENVRILSKAHLATMSSAKFKRTAEDAEPASSSRVRKSAKTASQGTEDSKSKAMSYFT
jgi:hypothetical protein